MAKEKITLTDLKVKSTSTVLSADEMTQVKGGLFTIKGRKYTYRTRWTSIDTRIEPEAAVVGGKLNSGT